MSQPPSHSKVFPRSGRAYVDSIRLIFCVFRAVDAHISFGRNLLFPPLRIRFLSDYSTLRTRRTLRPRSRSSFLTVLRFQLLKTTSHAPMPLVQEADQYKTPHVSNHSASCTKRTLYPLLRLLGLYVLK